MGGQAKSEFAGYLPEGPSILPTSLTRAISALISLPQAAPWADDSPSCLDLESTCQPNQPKLNLCFKLTVLRTENQSAHKGSPSQDEKFTGCRGRVLLSLWPAEPCASPPERATRPPRPPLQSRRPCVLLQPPRGRAVTRWPPRTPSAPRAAHPSCAAGSPHSWHQATPTRHSWVTI